MPPYIVVGNHSRPLPGILGSYGLGSGIAGCGLGKMVGIPEPVWGVSGICLGNVVGDCGSFFFVLGLPSQLSVLP